MSLVQWLRWATRNPQGISGDVKYTLRALRHEHGCDSCGRWRRLRFSAPHCARFCARCHARETTA